MTDIYKEAILEAKKIREVAEIDAKNKIIEAVSPLIKKMIMSETTSAGKYLFGEEGDDMSNVVDPGIQISDPTATVNPTDMSPVANPDVPTGAPISANGELAGMPMPDDEGKITLDFSQLFSLGGMGSSGMSAQPPATQTAMGAGADMMATGGMENALQNQDLAPVANVGSGLPTSPSGEVPALPASPGGISPDDAQQAAQPAATNPATTGAPTAPAPAQPGAIAPGTEEDEEQLAANQPPLAEEKINSFKNDVVFVAEKIELIRTTNSKSVFLKEFVKNKLFGLCEALDSMTKEGTISENKAKIVESKLEFLFSSLNEAKQDNSYKKDEGNKMTTLKEFAAKLFEEDALGPATADKATAHAEKVSGIQPGVDLLEGEDCKDEEMKQMAESLLGEEAPASSAFGDGKKEEGAETKSPKVHDGKALADKDGAGVVEESAPASSAFGDGSKATGAENTSPAVHAGKALADEVGANTILEFDEKELREAIAKVRKENLARKLAAVKESKEGALQGTDKKGHLKTPKVEEGDQGSAKPEGGKDPSQKNLKEETALSVDVSGGDEGEGVSDIADASDEVDLMFKVSVDDLEALLSGGVADFVAEPVGDEVSDDVISAGTDGGDDEIEVIDDETPEGEEGLLVDKDEELDETAPASASPSSSAGAAKTGGMMQESVQKKKIDELTKQLSESRLLTAKALYVSKFAVNKDLSSKQKQKIAMYFDRAKTLAEAKETYKKINKILSESSSTSNLSGSASKPTATGSARLLEESKNNSSDTVEQQRWMLLAGIKAKK